MIRQLSDWKLVVCLLILVVYAFVWKWTADFQAQTVDPPQGTVGVECGFGK